MIECLEELKDLPAKVADASWVERVAEEQAAGDGAPPEPQGRPARGKTPGRRQAAPK
jgi:hypothetical protein